MPAPHFTASSSSAIGSQCWPTGGEIDILEMNGDPLQGSERPSAYIFFDIYSRRTGFGPRITGLFQAPPLPLHSQPAAFTAFDASPGECGKDKEPIPGGSTRGGPRDDWQMDWHVYRSRDICGSCAQYVPLTRASIAAQCGTRCPSPTIWTAACTTP